jgi:hypothetical protein
VMVVALSLDELEHLGECLTPVDRRVGCPHEDGVKLIPADGKPFRSDRKGQIYQWDGAFASRQKPMEYVAQQSDQLASAAFMQ